MPIICKLLTKSGTFHKLIFKEPKWIIELYPPVNFCDEYPVYYINLKFNSPFICIEICKGVSVYSFRLYIIIYFAKAFVLLITKIAYLSLGIYMLSIIRNIYVKSKDVAKPNDLIPFIF